jgi:hypothetical protein
MRGAVLAMVGCALCGLLAAGRAHALGDEIQVYDGGLAAPGVFNLTWHNNYALDGLKQPEFPDGLVAQHALNGVPEWAYGVTHWFEAGLYMPLYTLDKRGSLTFNGFKLRTLFAVPDADSRRFFYGLNFEFSYNTLHWDENRYSNEIRPIVGWHLGKWDVVFNPILDNNYKGFGELDFAPATRIAYRINDTWQVAAEEYDDFGPLKGFLPGNEQSHQLYAVVNRKGKAWSWEAGVGVGLTHASDHVLVKLILERDLN